MEPKHNFEETDYSFLESYQSIDEEKDWNLVKNHIDFGSKRSLHRIWWSAAAVILLLGVGFLARQTWFSTPEMLNTLALESGQEVKLPDGSLVVLNTGSELSYREKFHRKAREVELSGEAYFEVTGDPAHPFVVNIGEKAKVEVLGTKFNIRSDGHEESVRVQVVEGRVAFSQSGGNLLHIILGKGEQAMLKDGALKKEEVMDLNFLSWKTGVLFFNQSPIEEVVAALEVHYGQELILAGTLSDNLTFTSIIDNQDLESVLDELSLVLGLEYMQREQKVLLIIPE